MINNKEKFFVAVRVRPSLKDDHKIYEDTEMEPILEPNTQDSLIIQRKNYEEKMFKFNQVFINESQHEIYERT